MKVVASGEGREYDLELIEEGGRHLLIDGDERVPFELVPGTGPVRRIRIGDREVVFGVRRQGSSFQIVLDALDYDVEMCDPHAPRPREDRGGSVRGGKIVAPIPGRVVRFLVELGATVDRGEPIVVLDAMKLENEIGSPASGTVARCLGEAGDTVEKGQLLAEIEP